MRVVLVGAAGRMGRAIEAAAAAAPDVEIGARVDQRANFPPGGGVWTDDVASVTRAGDVVVEFSSPAGARAAAAACTSKGAALVSGATGLSAEDEAAVRAAASRVPVLRASNFSLGAAALRRVLRAALESLPEEWDVEIVERHHRLKRDSPSGTALTLASDVRTARGFSEQAIRNGRVGAVGPRPRAEVGVHALRGGTWVGDHLILLAGDGESLELRHVAQDRAAFAQGALAAARFLTKAGAGWFTMEDVLRAPGSRGR